MLLARHILPLLGLLVVAMVSASALSLIPERAENQAASVSAAEVIALTNQERSDEGIAVLKRNAKLDRAAQMKAEDMAVKGYYAHVSPEGVTPMYFVERAGYEYLAIGENLVVNRTDADKVVDAFMGSPGHRANILRRDFTEIGVGVAKGTYKGRDAVFTVQMFGAPKSVSKPTVAAAPAKPVAAATVAVTPKPTAPAPVQPQPALIKEVKEFVKPLTPLIASTTATTTATSTVSIATSTEYVPTLFHIESVSPIELAGVSRLETRTTPVPVGSVWTERFQVLIDQIVLSARKLF